jgi:hypothetical protein
MRYAVEFFVTLLLVTFSCVYSFKGYVANGMTALSISSESYVDVNNLLLTVVTTTSNDKLILTVMLAVKFSSPNGWMKFNILRNGAALSSTSLRFVRSTGAEVQPIIISIGDLPNAANSYTYKVQAAGYGELGNGARIRQFSCIQMPGSTAGGYMTLTGKVTPPSTTLAGLTVSVSPSSTTDKVLVFVNMDATNVTTQEDIWMQFKRGSTVLAPISKFGYANSISIPLGMLDSPASIASVTYSPAISRIGSSQAIMCGGGSPAQLYAYVVPAALTASVATSTKITVSANVWTSLGLSVTITPQSTADKVMIMFNADLIFMSGPPYQLGLTIFRGGANLGDSTYGLLMLDVGTLQYARRSPVMMFMDAPGVTSATTYAVYAYIGSSTGPSIEFGRGNLETSLVAVLVTEGPMPTATPTRAPTAAPTAAPTFVPTLTPAAGPTLPPTASPSFTPSPTVAPTLAPTIKPTTAPSPGPTAAPSANPTINPSASPTCSPSGSPTLAPTAPPTLPPTSAPTQAPSAKPTLVPSCSPTCAPTSKPTVPPTLPPSAKPSLTPSKVPTVLPSASPTPAPTSTPARWAGASRTLTSDLVLSGDGFVDTGLELTVTTTVTDDKVVITFMATVEFTAANQYMQFKVLCNNGEVYGSNVRYVRADRAGELAPVLFTFADNLSMPGAYSFRVLAAGHGVLGAAGRLRTLTVLQIPASVSTGISTVGGMVTPPENGLGLAATVLLSSAADAVLLMASVDAANATLPADFMLHFIRNQDAEIGTEALFGSASGVSAPVGMLDWPRQFGPVEYEVDFHRASVASTAVIGGNGAVRAMYALVVPVALCKNMATNEDIFIAGESFGSVALNVAVTTSSATDKVLLTFNADLLITRMVDSAPAATACFSFLRNGFALLGDSNNGLLCISPGAVSSARRSPMMVHLDTPNVAGLVTYTVVAFNSAPGQYEFKLGHGSVESSVTAILLNGAEVPTYSPTAAPTVRPSTCPSKGPTQPPTVSPTMPPTTAPTSVPTKEPSTNPTLAPTTAPSAGPTASPTASPSQAPTVNPTTPPTARPSAAPTATPTAAPCAAPTTAPSAPPTAEPSLTPTKAPTAEPTTSPSAKPSSFPTTSPSADPSAAPSAAPTALPSTLVPTAKPTAAPTAGPTVYGVDCSVYCQIGGGGSYQVTAGQLIGTYRLSTYFTLSFLIYNPAVWPTGQAFNILKMYDTTTGGNFLTIGMSSSPYYLEVIYGNTQVVQSAGLIAYDYQNYWQGMTFAVDASGFYVSSDRTGYSVTVSVPVIETYGRAYSMYASAPGLTSSGGYVYNMQLQSKWFRYCAELLAGY